eukprot:12451040-Ditylum_brightwellii.AAC.1
MGTRRGDSIFIWGDSFLISAGFLATGLGLRSRLAGGLCATFLTSSTLSELSGAVLSELSFESKHLA